MSNHKDGWTDTLEGTQTQSSLWHLELGYHITFLVHSKRETVPAHTMNAYRGNRGIAPLILDLRH